MEVSKTDEVPKMHKPKKTEVIRWGKKRTEKKVYLSGSEKFLLNESKGSGL